MDNSYVEYLDAIQINLMLDITSCTGDYEDFFNYINMKKFQKNERKKKQEQVEAVPSWYEDLLRIRRNRRSASF